MFKTLRRALLAVALILPAGLLIVKFLEPSPPDLAVDLVWLILGVPIVCANYVEYFEPEARDNLYSKKWWNEPIRDNMFSDSEMEKR